MDLTLVYDFIDSVKTSKERKQKLSLLGTGYKIPLIKNCLDYATNDNQYNLVKLPKSTSYIDNDIFVLLDSLVQQGSSTKVQAEELANSCLNEKTRYVVQRMLKKGFDFGVSSSTIRKEIFKEKPFSVALCSSDVNKFFKKTKPSDTLVSWKLDGVRCMVYVYEDKVVYYSRNGKVYPNFHDFDHNMIDYAKQTGLSFPVVLDGEMMSKDGFQSTMSQLFSKTDLDLSSFSFHIFDIEMDGPLWKRLEVLKSCKNDRISIVDHVPLVELDKHHDEALELGYEGLVIKDKNGRYERKRLDTWCKVKRFHSIDADVIGYELGSGRLKDVLGALCCEWEGNKFNVGSGFTDEQRTEFLTNTPKMIEVKYQELSSDNIPRFPVFIRTREDKE